MGILFIAVGLWITFLISANLWIWIRPKFSSALSQTIVATALALTLFLSCFVFGVWIGILKLKGELGVFL